MGNRIRCAALVLSLLLLLCVPAAALPGDLNNDNAVDYTDAIYLLYHTTLPTEYPLTQAADYTNDGTVDTADALCLLYHTLLPDQYPLPAVISLPQIGYDPDSKGRILLTSIEVEGDTVVATFQNQSRTWVTEETSALTYTCTAADGTLLKSGSVHLGYLKCGATTQCRIPLPAGTAAFTFTGGSIFYWSAWKQ